MELDKFLFGSIGKEYCMYFLLLSMIGLFLSVVFVISGIIVGVSTKKNLFFYIQIAIVAFLYAMFYLTNRLLYNMCKSSI